MTVANEMSYLGNEAFDSHSISAFDAKTQAQILESILLPENPRSPINNPNNPYSVRRIAIMIAAYFEELRLELDRQYTIFNEAAYYRKQLEEAELEAEDTEKAESYYHQSEEEKELVEEKETAIEQCIKLAGQNFTDLYQELLAFQQIQNTLYQTHSHNVITIINQFMVPIIDQIIEELFKENASAAQQIEIHGGVKSFSEKLTKQVFSRLADTSTKNVKENQSSLENIREIFNSKNFSNDALSQDFRKILANDILIKSPRVKPVNEEEEINFSAARLQVWVISAYTTAFKDMGISFSHTVSIYHKPEILQNIQNMNFALKTTYHSYYQQANIISESRKNLQAKLKFIPENLVNAMRRESVGPQSSSFYDAKNTSSNPNLLAMLMQVNQTSKQASLDKLNSSLSKLLK